MNTPIWGRSRPLLLYGLGLSICLIAAKWAIAPTYRSYTPTAFPEALPLLRWQPVHSSPLSRSADSADLAINRSRDDQILSARTYTYRRDGLTLRVELRDVFTTTGDVTQLLEKHYPIDSETLNFQAQHSEIGYAQTFTDGDRTYLSSCLHSTDQATITAEQFQQASYGHSLWSPQRLVQWVQGEISLPNQRCLWVTLSVPHDAAQNPASIAILQDAWLAIASQLQ